MSDTPDATVKMFRYEDVAYSTGVTMDGERSSGSRIEVELREYDVIKKTAKGCWIAMYGRELAIDFGLSKKFILTGARKRFACPTIEEARISFMARKKKQIRIYKAKILRAEEALRAIR